MLVTEKYGLSSSLCAAAVSKEEPCGPPNPCSRKGVRLKKNMFCCKSKCKLLHHLSAISKVKSLAVGYCSVIEAHFGFLRQSEVGTSLCLVQDIAHNCISISKTFCLKFVFMIWFVLSLMRHPFKGCCCFTVKVWLDCKELPCNEDLGTSSLAPWNEPSCLPSLLQTWVADNQGPSVPAPAVTHPVDVCASASISVFCAFLPGLMLAFSLWCSCLTVISGHWRLCGWLCWEMSTHTRAADTERRLVG